MVATQIAGQSNGGRALAVKDRAPVRTASVDPSGDALSNYSLMAPAVVPPDPPTKNERAGDFTSATVSPDKATGGFTVTLKVADLSTAGLTQALADTGGQSLQWIWRFANGYQDAAASAAWSPVGGFTFGFDPYTVGGAPCETGTGAASEKCQVYPQSQPIHGSVNQVTGTIVLVVPKSVLKQLSGTDADGRPVEQAAAAGARFYDGTAFSFANNAAPTPSSQSFLYTLDNTPAFDFLLKR
jgi:hypothetical protein